MDNYICQVKNISDRSKMVTKYLTFYNLKKQDFFA